MTEEAAVASEVRSYLAEALAIAQERAVAVAKKLSAPQYGTNKITSTEDILQVVKEANTGLGLSVRPVRCPISRNAAGDPVGITRVISIMHKSGESLEIETEWPVERKTRKDGTPSQGWDDAIATAQTRSLGYLLRDAYGLPRLKEEDMPAHPGAPADEGPSAWVIRRDEWTVQAKSLLGAGWTKSELVAKLRSLGLDVEDGGKWGKEPTEDVAAKVEAFFKSPLKDAGAKPAAGAAPSSKPADGAPATPSTTSPSSVKVEPPKENAPITPAEKAAAVPATSGVPKEKLDRLGAAAIEGMKLHGATKAEVIAMFREATGTVGTDDFVTDGGKFLKAVSPETYKKAVEGFKAWEKKKMAEKKPGAPKTPEEEAEEAAAQWAAASEGSAAPQQ